jgi:pimeloyl-ACP methyl ester carboxylesterase
MKPTLTLLTVLLLAPPAAMQAADAPKQKARIPPDHGGKADEWIHVEHEAKSGNRITAEVRKGTCATLILIPGTWGNAKFRTRLVDALNPDFTLVCVALAGQDDNWPPPSDPSIPQFSQDVLCLADELGLKTFFVGGNSLGGMISIDMLRLCPDRILGAIPIEGWTSWQASVSAFGGDTTSTLTAEQHNYIGQVRRELLDRWEPTLRDKYGAMWKKWDGWETLATTQVPVLEVWGDRKRPRPSREKLRIPDRDNIRVEWIAGASHSLLIEAPERLAELINRFVVAHREIAHPARETSVEDRLR